MNINNYAGIPDEYAKYDNCKVIVLPVPYDATSTWGKGADKAPEAFLKASENMELYDIETDTEVYKQGVWLAEPLIAASNPEKMTEQIKSEANKYFKDKKIFTMIGGEHSVSIGAIMAANENFDNLSVLQLDAHSDLRPEYNNSKYNHACAMHWASKNTNLVQVGIRSMDADEKQYMNKLNVFFAENIVNNNSEWQKNVVEKLTDNVYVSIDLDYFDPSIMPSTGTPEPGGMGWYETLKLLKILSFQKNIIGFDIVELAPDKSNKAPDFLTAKLYYKFLSYIFNKK